MADNKNTLSATNNHLYIGKSNGLIHRACMDRLLHGRGGNLHVSLK